MNYQYKYLKYKNKYLKLINQLGGSFWEDPNNHQHIHAAGLILIENYRGVPSIIFFRSLLAPPRHGKYELPGGSIDHGSNPWVTAVKELREESRGLFNINANFINNPANRVQYIDVPYTCGPHTCYNRQYILYITGHDGHIQGGDYLHNINIIDANITRLRPHHPLQYKETNDICRIDIRNINKIIPGAHRGTDIMIMGTSKSVGNIMITIPPIQVHILRHCLTTINTVIAVRNIIKLNYNPNDTRNPSSPYYGTRTNWIN